MADCFEEIYEEEILKDSATCTKEALRIILALIAQELFFLQGEEIDRKVFVKPPKEVETNNVWLFKKCLYGLRNASCVTIE